MDAKQLLLVFLFAVSWELSNQADDAPLDAIIEEIFSSENVKPDRVCNQVDAELRGCHDCYPCNHSVIVHYKQIREPIQEMRLINSECLPSTVCCVSQSVLVNARQDGVMCGRRRDPKRRRQSPRSVLQSEYPWHAFVYSKQGNIKTLLCAATYIDDNARALLTTAACVKNVPSNSLYISFSIPPGQGEIVPVEKVIVHSNYQKDQHLNNIAMLKLSPHTTIPRYVGPLCLPLLPPSHAAVCYTIANNEYRINTFIPRHKVCDRANSDRPLPAQLLCAAAAGGGDYLPRDGAALFCEEKNDASPVHVMHGIASHSPSDSVSIYTNISNYIEWLQDNL